MQITVYCAYLAIIPIVEICSIEQVQRHGQYTTWLVGIFFTLDDVRNDPIALQAGSYIEVGEFL